MFFIALVVSFILKLRFPVNRSFRDMISTSFKVVNIRKDVRKFTLCTDVLDASVGALTSLVWLRWKVAGNWLNWSPLLTSLFFFCSSFKVIEDSPFMEKNKKKNWNEINMIGSLWDLLGKTFEIITLHCGNLILFWQKNKLNCLRLVNF